MDTLVVACRGCNSDRKDGKPGFKLRAAPVVPHYEPSTIDFINRHEWSVANGIHIEKAQAELELKPAAARVDGAPQGAGAARETAAASHSPAAHSTTGAARDVDTSTKSNADPIGYPLDIPGSQGDDPGLSGSGRVGSGRAGQARKRRRRGRRGGKD